jgi:hypothetical protein
MIDDMGSIEDSSIGTFGLSIPHDSGQYPGFCTVGLIHDLTEIVV